MGESLEQQLESADACLMMVREQLERLGLPMGGCPPMMYDDAIRALASRIGRYGGLRTWDQLRAVVMRPTALVLYHPRRHQWANT